MDKTETPSNAGMRGLFLSTAYLGDACRMTANEASTQGTSAP